MDTDLFNTNASIVRDLAKAAADNAPEAKMLIISNPVYNKPFVQEHKQLVDVLLR